MTTLHLKKSIGRSPWRFGFLLIPFALACFALSPSARGVSPAPDGGYGNQNTAEGTDALNALTTGVWNTAVGFHALFNNTTGNQNTALGKDALAANVSGNKSVAFGAQALTNNSTGTQNTATGFNTLFTNTSGNNNTGNGYRCLNFNNGNDNTAMGFNANFNNRGGSDTTAVGSGALLHNFNASDNTGVGFEALRENISTSFNVAVGDSALVNFNGTTAVDGANTALGSIALFSELSGQENVAVGRRALESLISASNNTAVGWRAGDFVIDGNNDVAIGSSAGTTFVHASNNIAIGAPGAGPFADVNNTCFIGSIHGEPVSDATSQQAVFVDKFNVVGIQVSSRRYKHDIQPMDKGSEAILALKPVTFKYNSDKKGAPQYGLIAEDVAQVNPDLVTRDENGDVQTVRYEQVNAMLLNEFLKEHKKVQDLEVTVAQQQKGMEVLTAQLKEQAAQIQKVSAQVEMRKSTPKVVVNNP
jgi:trimeric autotransporter adhesin